MENINHVQYIQESFKNIKDAEERKKMIIKDKNDLIDDINIEIDDMYKEISFHIKELK